MAEPQEYFELPRLDWYDDKGRIFKDRLIENFNALEEKLLQLARLKVYEMEPPVISGIVFPDTTLESDDNKIVNLKSFLEITGLMNYPLELVFTGKTCVKLCYWTNEYKYASIENKKINCSDEKPYIYFNFNTREFIPSDSTETPEDCKFIAFYTNDKIIGLNNNDYIDINALFYLANMQIDTYPKTYNSGTREDADRDRGYIRNNRWLGGAATNTGTRGENSVIYKDTGRVSS